MRQSGNQSEDNFRRTVINCFPDLDPKDIVLVTDGTVVGYANSKREPQTTYASQNSVVWKGSFTDLGGYANMNREICMRLIQRGFSVKIDMLRTAPQVDDGTMSMINAMSSVKLRNEYTSPLVVGFTPMPVASRGRKVVFYTMMETQGVHKEFVNRCNKYPNEIWVPCKFYMDAFKTAGIAKPTYLMPLGVNHNIYTPDAIEPYLRYEEMPSGKVVDRLPEGFRFISLFGWSFRKGPDVLCRSFLREFTANEDAILVIYSRYMGGSGDPQKEYCRKEIREYLSEIKHDAPGRIYYCGDSVPIQDLPGVYAAADCFVFCSRGEGFGLPVIEAGACDIPVISTYNTAMTQYLDDEVAYTVQTDEIAPANEKLTWITEFYRDQSFPVLGDSAIMEFSRLMRQVYANPKEAGAKASKFKDRILKEYTWDACADRVAKRLKSI